MTTNALPESEDMFAQFMSNLDAGLAEMQEAAAAALSEGSDSEFDYMVAADGTNLTVKSGMYMEARIANLLSMSENAIYSPAARREAARKSAVMLGIAPTVVGGEDRNG